MYQFLCLFGPAVLTWRLREKILNSDKNKEQDGKVKIILSAAAEIISYALINMAVVLLILKPLGRVQLVILADGRLDIQYGITSILASICVAVVLGVTSIKNFSK